MKKLSLFLVFSFVFLLSAVAQDNSGSNGLFGGIGIKGNVYLNEAANIKANFSDNIKTFEKPSIAGDLFFGKWFSDKVGGRVYVEGGQLKLYGSKAGIATSDHVDATYLLGRVDFMLKLLNFFRPYSSEHFYELVPYVGVGYTSALGDFKSGSVALKNLDNKGSFVGAGGLLNTFRVADKISVFLDLSVNVFDTKFDGYKNEKATNSIKKNFNGIAGASVGVIYNFGAPVQKEVVAPPVPVEEPVAPQPVVEPQQPQQPQPQPQTEQVAPKVEVATPAPAPTFDNVYFRFDKAIVDADQQVKIKKVADYLQANPTAKITVVGYADKTGSSVYNMGLSEKRAKAVASQLTTKYNIDSNRIKVDWKGDSVQPFAEKAKNRVVIFTN